MTNFAQALARIEKLKSTPSMTYYEAVELKRLLLDHADSIVQLGKVAWYQSQHFPGESCSHI